MILASLLWMRLTAAAQPGTPELTSGLINPQGIVFSPKCHKVYVADRAHGAVDVIDTASRKVSAVAVGAAPVSIAADPASGRIYVANAGDGTVSVIDGASDKVLATVTVGTHPYSIAVNPRTGVVYVSHTFSNRTTAFDPATSGVTQLVTGSIDLIAIDAAADTAYLLAYESGTLTTLEGPGHAIQKREAGQHAWGMAVNEATHTVYAAHMGMGDAIALRGTASSILRAGHTPCAVAVNPRTDAVYVANYADGGVTVFEKGGMEAGGRAVATIPAGVHPQALAVDAQRGLVYAANTWSGTVTVIDAERRKGVATLPAGKAPYALAVDPGSAKLYVANEAGERPFTIVDVEPDRKAK